MTEHTPTPWKLREPAMIQGAPKEGEAYGELVVNYGGLAKPATVGRANAAFIVRAVNSHNALVEALTEARLQIEYLDAKFQPIGTSAAALARINAALALSSDGLKDGAT